MWRAKKKDPLRYYHEKPSQNNDWLPQSYELISQINEELSWNNFSQKKNKWNVTNATLNIDLI